MPFPTARRILLGTHEDRLHSRLMHYLEASEAVFVLGNDARSLDDIRGPLTFVGRNINSIALNDQGDTNGNTYGFTSTSVTTPSSVRCSCISSSTKNV